MPGLAFEDDEEPGGHVTQHEEQLAQVGLQVTLGSMRQASSQLLMMAVKSSVRNLITPHLTFLPPGLSLCQEMTVRRCSPSQFTSVVM